LQGYIALFLGITAQVLLQGMPNTFFQALTLDVLNLLQGDFHRNLTLFLGKLYSIRQKVLNYLHESSGITIHISKNIKILFFFIE
jgi:hypothetical protein